MIVLGSVFLIVGGLILILNIFIAGQEPPENTRMANIVGGLGVLLGLLLISLHLVG